MTTTLQATVWLVLALLAGALGGLSDLAKASLVRHETRLLGALGQAWAGLRHQPIRACFGWLPYAVAFVLVALLAARLSAALDVSRSGAWRVVAIFSLHQLVIVSSVAARAGWYARALRLVATDV